MSRELARANARGRPVRVLYDGLIFSAQGAGGINRFFSNVIPRLPAAWQPTLTIARRKDRDLPQHPHLRTHIVPGGLPYRISRAFEIPYFRFLQQSGRFDIAHPTYYYLLTGRPLSAYQCPVVLTVWDMIHERFPEILDPRGQTAHLKRLAVDQADHVICISESTRRDLLELTDIDPDKVSVIYLAASLMTDRAAPDAPTPKSPYVLYVGSRASYKNFSCLLDALAAMGPDYSELMLRVAGTGLTAEEQHEIASRGLESRVVEMGQVDDSQLVSLYRSSLALVYPSRYEGFGIPPLEAMACGTVAVVANTSSLPEVVGSAGVLFDPDEPRELADVLERLLREPTYRQQLVTRGANQVQRFSWDDTAARTIAVYESLAGPTGPAESDDGT